MTDQTIRLVCFYVCTESLLNLPIQYKMLRKGYVQKRKLIPVVICQIYMIPANIISCFFDRLYKGKAYNEYRWLKGGIVYYEVNIDILFISNLIMNTSVLILEKQSYPHPVSKGRIILGAFTGAFLYSILLCVPYFNFYYRSLFALFLSGLIMIIMVYPATGLKFFLSRYVHVILFYMFMEGIMAVERQFLPSFKVQYFDIFSLMLCAMVATGVLWVRGKMKKRKNAELVKTKLQSGSWFKECLGFLDTGNRLCEPISCRPVCIVDTHIYKECRESADADACQSRIRIVPFHSVGREHGIMEGYRIDRLDVRLNDEILSFENVYLCEGKEIFFKGKSYQIILHGDMQRHDTN